MMEGPLSSCGVRTSAGAGPTQWARE